MKKSKIISALLCASRVIGMLSGCGGGSSVPASGENAGIPILQIQNFYITVYMVDSQTNNK